MDGQKAFRLGEKTTPNNINERGRDMIIFEGKISGQCFENYDKRYRKEYLMIMSIVSLIILFIVFLIWGLNLILLLCVGVCALTYVPLLFRFNHSSVLPYKMTVDLNEGTVIFNSKNREDFMMINDIDTIYDFGEYYQIEDASYMFFCQKNLLVQGTLEEFEKAFEGKIMRKY